MEDNETLARSWIFAQKQDIDSPAYARHGWAVDRLIEFAVDEPDKLWQVILRILEIDDSAEILKAVGAGPLEDLMVHHGEALIDRVESEASRSEIFRRAMGSVWLEKDDTSVYERFFEIAGMPPPL